MSLVPVIYLILVNGQWWAVNRETWVWRARIHSRL